MGRRPNSVVTEFFERGAKLEDNSNRYSHSCKRCGEEFPKGRVDSLTGHLLRKCPNINQDDRDWILHELQQNPERPQKSKSKPLFQHSQPEPDPPVSNYQQSALDTLAEVSRHHLDYSSQRRISGTLHESKDAASLNDQAILAHLQDLTHHAESPATGEVHQTDGLRDIPQQQSYTTSFPPQIPSSDLTSSGLVQTASAANHRLEAVQANTFEQEHSEEVVDPGLHTEPGPVHTQRQPLGVSDSDFDSTAWHQLDAPLELGGPVDTFLPDMTAPQKALQRRVRGHFGDSRRKEVAKIRKRGACLRCRMLKKPCSGETPCSTCRNVETARLWKGQCLRTRVVEEFTLWSARLFYQQAHLQMAAAVYGQEQSPIPGRIEARFGGSNLGMSFAVKVCGGESQSSSPQTAPTLLLGDDGIIEKVEAYMIQCADGILNGETPFLKATLQRAQLMSRADEAEHAVKENVQLQPTRSCYSLQNRLLRNVIDLWLLTNVLTMPAKYVLQLQYHAGSQSQHYTNLETWNNDQANTDVHPILTGSQSYRLIYTQILAAVESRCISLSKTILNELEHRLLQRQQASRFATLISAVILLNCVERMTGLYKSFDTNADEPRGESLDNEGAAKLLAAAWGDLSHSKNEYDAWPLDSPPSALWPQGPRFAELLTMLLRLRGLPPKTYRQDVEATLAVEQSYSSPVQLSGRPLQEQANEQNKLAAAWLDPLRLHVDDLLAKRDGHLPAKTDRVEAWDMMFISKVLLPDNVG